MLFQPLGFLRAANGFRARELLFCALFFGVAPAVSAADVVSEGGQDHRHDCRTRFLRKMPATVRADHPAIVPIADAICRITADPVEQLVIVNDVTHLLVDYDDDERVYGCTEFHATLDEMIARRREEGWVYLRDDCDGRAVFAAHLLAALGIPWRLEASYWMQHAWVTARVGELEYDLLEFRTIRPEMKSIGYRLVGRHFIAAERRPPFFAWRAAWRVRTDADVEIGKRLGLLTPDSTAGNLIERYATDWTELQPAGHDSPRETRYATVACAGFPYGEPLNPSGIGRALAMRVTRRSESSLALRAADDHREAP